MLDIGKPSFSKWAEVESRIKLVLNTEELKHVDAKSLSTHTSKSRGVSKKFLSKPWLVTENLVEKEIDTNTQLRRQSKDNILSLNYKTNDRMLRQKRLESAFFTDTMFATTHKSTRGNKC